MLGMLSELSWLSRLEKFVCEEEEEDVCGSAPNHWREPIIVVFTRSETKIYYGVL